MEEVVMVHEDVGRRRIGLLRHMRTEIKISFLFSTCDGHKVAHYCIKPGVLSARVGKGGCHGYGKAKPRSNKACMGQVTWCEVLKFMLMVK
jgi:hypothetical protein